MIVRLPLVIVLALLVAGCAPRDGVPADHSRAPFQGLQAIDRVRVTVVAPDVRHRHPLFHAIPQGEGEPEALRKHVIDSLNTLLPELRTDGLSEDWVLEVTAEWQFENLPSGAAAVPRHWAVCSLRLTKTVLVDGRRVSAVAYAGPVLWPERPAFSYETPWPGSLHEAIDRAIPAFVADWHAANPR